MIWERGAQPKANTFIRINDIQGRIGSMASSSGLITDEPEFHEAKSRIAP